MNIQKIAEFLLERRHRASPVVLNGEVIEAIQSEGLQEALLRRWLVPDQDTGNLQITFSPAHIAEMEAVARSPDVGGCTMENGATSLILGHAQRSRLDEISAPGTGKPAPSMGAVAPPQPPPVSTPSASPTPTAQTSTATPVAPGSSNPEKGDKPLDTNDNVTVAQEGGGRTYTGKVSSRTPGGMRVTFGPDKPR